MSDTTPIPPASERERFEAWADSRKGASLRHSMDGGFDYPLGRLLREAFEAGAALSHPSTPQGWQPIETCPHDGEVVDFWIPDGGTARARADDYWAGAHWLKAATHWSRLLSPPEQGGKG